MDSLGSVRPIHRADVHIIEPQGSELWLDVKTHTVNTDHEVAKELLREEMTKCRAYGQRDGFNLQALDKGMTRVVMEQFGRTAPGAQAIFNRIINHRLQILVRQGIHSHSPRRPLAPSYGVQSHVRCSEQLGKHMRSVHPASARPTKRHKSSKKCHDIFCDFLPSPFCRPFFYSPIQGMTGIQFSQDGYILLIISFSSRKWAEYGFGE